MPTAATRRFIAAQSTRGAPTCPAPRRSSFGAADFTVLAALCKLGSTAGFAGERDHYPSMTAGCAAIHAAGDRTGT